MSNTKTIFCDIDGTLIKHSGDVYNHKLNPELLNNSIKTL